MARKVVVYVISIFIMGTGLARIWAFFLPLSDPTKPKVLDPFLLLVGIFVFIAGWNLFRLKEFGWEVTFWLLVMGLMGNLLVFGLVLPPDSKFSVLRKLAGKTILDSKNNYLATIILLSALLVVNLSAIIFLLQEKTRNLFTRQSTDSMMSGSSVETKSKE